MALAGSENKDMRIPGRHPAIPWAQVWTNLHKAWITDQLKSTWYKVIHEIVPTNDRLAAIRLADTDLCTDCGKTDSTSHRLMECGEGPVIWNWTRAWIVALLRTNPHVIPADWTLRPAFHFWPPSKQAAIVWLLAHMVAYQIQNQRHLSLLYHTDFLRRARWKAYQQPLRRNTVGNYLDIL